MGFGRTNSCTPAKKMQEKTVSITENGSLEIVPDSGYDAMSKVIADVGVSSAPKQASGSVTVTMVPEEITSFTCGTVDFTPVVCGWSVDYQGSSSSHFEKGASYNFDGTSYGSVCARYGNRYYVVDGETTLSGSTISGSINSTGFVSNVTYTVTVNWWAVGV